MAAVMLTTWLGLSLLSGCPAGTSPPWGSSPGMNNPSGQETYFTTSDDTGDTAGPPDTGTGYGFGDVAYNLTATAQDKASWSLYSQFGTPVVLLVGHLDVGTVMSQPLSMVGDTAREAGAVSVLLLGRDEYSTVSNLSLIHI